MHSLRIRLFGLWLLSLVGGVAVAALLVALYQRSAQAQIGQAEAVIAGGCDLIREAYGVFVGPGSGPPPDLADPALRARLAGVVGRALAQREGIEGGLWQTGSGPLAYAFPTYAGTGPKTDLPVAERGQIEAVNRQAARQQQQASHRVASHAQTVLLHACPLSPSITGLPTASLTAWTMTRVNAVPGLGRLVLGLAVLLALLLGMAAWLGRTLLVWGRHIRGIEAALASAGPQGMADVPLTGERELDRIVGALNDAGQRLASARRDADAMAERIARAERLAGLGRVAAGVAHEIRNPIAAARLQGENALAGDDVRRKEAIGDMLAQLGRLDGLVGELLAMTQRVTPSPTTVDLAALLAGCRARHAVIAADRAVEVRLLGAEGTATLDPAMIGRVLDNLVANAVRHAPEGGQVTIAVERDSARLTIVVEDSGTGVAPALTAKLFEPFATGRPDGTGLGLAIARQLADAHGGRLVLRRAGGAQPGKGAVFALELPWELPWELPCRPS